MSVHFFSTVIHCFDYYGAILFTTWAENIVSHEKRIAKILSLSNFIIVYFTYYYLLYSILSGPLFFSHDSFPRFPDSVQPFHSY